MNQAETASDDEGAAKLVLHVLGAGVGGHVEVLGHNAQQRVAYGTTNNVGLEARPLQAITHVHGVFAHVFGSDAELCS